MSAVAVAIALQVTCTAHCQTTSPADATGNQLLTLDMRVGDEDAVLVVVEGGPVLRIPRALVGGAFLPERSTDRIHLSFFVSQFAYPELTFGRSMPRFTSPSDALVGKYIPQPDRFPVYLTMSFSPDKSDQIRPSTMFRHLESNGLLAAHATEKKPTTFTDSFIEGLVEAHFPIYDQAYVDRFVKATKENGSYSLEIAVRVYVGKPDGPFDILMHCAPMVGNTCKADVYSKATHFQYRMFFPGEAAPHAFDLFTRIDSVVKSWTQ